VCQTRSMSSVGTKNETGEELMRSRKLYKRRVLSRLEVEQKKVAYAWYLAKAC